MYDLEELALMNGIALGQLDEYDEPVPLLTDGPVSDAVSEAIADAAAAAGGVLVSQAIADAAALIPSGEPMGSGWPAAVPVRPSNWDLSTTPAAYMIAAGDTFAGLAATYLGAASRWQDIWDEQPQEYRWSRSADDIFPGEVIAMPEEARINFLKLKRGQPIPGDQPAPGVLPGEPKKKSKMPWLLAGGAAAAAAAYAFTR